MKSASAVIVAAGKGERLGSAKQYLPLGGIPILQWSVRTFAGHPGVGEIVVVLPAEQVAEPPDWLTASSVRCCPGGKTRRESAGAGVLAADPGAEFILIHDAARPFVSSAVIDRVLAGASRSGAALPVLPVVDTIKRTEGGLVVDTVARSGLGRAQTPQAFEAQLIRGLHARASETGSIASDDAALCEEAGQAVTVVEGDPWNLKITTRADLDLANWLVESGRLRAPLSGNVAGGPV